MRVSEALAAARAALAAVVAGLLWGASAQALSPAAITAMQRPATLASLLPEQGDRPPPPWRFVGFPPARAQLAPTRFAIERIDGERALKVSTQASYGTLVHDLPLGPAARLQWQWRLDQPLSGGTAPPDIRTRAGDDAALKVCVMFNHPIERVPFVERTLLRIARSVSGEDLPAATLCYVWDSTYPAGTEGTNPYTRRVRFVVLQGRNAPLAQWQAEARDVTADFLQAFADEWPAGAPAPQVRAVLVGADSDNTGSSSQGWVRGLSWLPWTPGAPVDGR